MICSLLVVISQKCTRDKEWPDKITIGKPFFFMKSRIRGKPTSLDFISVSDVTVSQQNSNLV